MDAQTRFKAKVEEYINRYGPEWSDELTDEELEEMWELGAAACEAEHGVPVRRFRWSA